MKSLGIVILGWFGIWISVAFWSVPKQKCLQQQEVAYKLEPLFLNYSTVDNVQNATKPMDWPSNIIVPKNCNFTKNISFIIIVHSAGNNLDRRETLRKQFDYHQQEFYNFKVVFALGRSEDAVIQAKIEKEAEQFGDILQTHGIEDYKHLTYKAQAWISYFSQKWSQIRHIVKMDDDVSVNIQMLVQFLSQQQDKRKALFCSSMKHIADRRTSSKWYLSVDEFPYRNLGVFCAGLAYVFTSDLLQPMYERVKTRRLVWLDDWFVTHALLNDVDFTLYDTDDLYLSSETSSEAFRKLRQILLHQRPVPIFTHLRPRTFLTEKKQAELWRYSQPCN